MLKVKNTPFYHFYPIYSVQTDPKSWAWLGMWSPNLMSLWDPHLLIVLFFLKFTLASHWWKTGNRAHADDFDAMFEAWQARHGAGKFCSCAVHNYISTARMDECTILLWLYVRCSDIQNPPKNHLENQKTNYSPPQLFDI